MELRFCELTDIETRDDTLEISGYAIVFNEPSVTLGGKNGFKEIISEEALRGVDLGDTHLYYQHKSDQILANTKSETMSLEVTNKGLYFRANLADTTLGRDTYKLVKRGDLSAMSFGFTVEQDTWDMTTTPEVRTVTKIGRLDEVSIVSRPAYQQSSVNTRSMEFLEDCRECRFEKSEQETKSINRLEEAQSIIDSVQN